MFKNISHKRKFSLLVIALFVFMLIAYNLALKKTVMVISEYNRVNNEIEDYIAIPEQIKRIKEVALRYDNQIEKSYSKLPVQVFVLEYVANYCKANNIVIKEFPKAHNFNNSNFTIETNRIIFKGSFIPILKLIYNIEQQYRVGKISSVKFYKAFNNKTKSTELYADIYIQKIKRNEVD